MAKIGDQVRVTIQGPAELSGTATLNRGQITVSGIIIGESGEEWIVELDASFDGRNRLRIRKSAVRDLIAGSHS